MTTDPRTQTAYQVRFEWGQAGLGALAPLSSTVVIVDVLSFSTAVDVAVSRGGAVWPSAAWRDQAAAAAQAAALDAWLATTRRGQESIEQPYSLSPASLRGMPAGTRLVLPSPNGSTLTAQAARSGARVIAGCLRNAAAVAAFLAGQPKQTTTVIAAGERWPDGSLRVAVEDLLGAAAILSELPAEGRSPEASLAVHAYAHAALRGTLQQVLLDCASGRELVERGFAEDVAIAAELNASTSVPVLRDGVYRALRES